MTLEEWLRTALAQEAERVEVGPELVEKIKSRVVSQRAKRRRGSVAWRNRGKREIATGRPRSSSGQGKG